MGFNYIGPMDGHDVKALVSALRNIRKLRGPQFLHVVTRKGKGYAPAEADPIKWHGPGPFDPVSGTIFKEKSAGPTYSQIFGQWLCDMAEADPRIIGVTPAMREGSGLVEFSKRFPDRYFDVAIAEQHAVTFAAGMAAEGLKPVVAIYSTFLQRAYDQLIHDVALQSLPVVFAVDRAGLVGSDGATHQGSYDLSYLRCIPNTVVMAPADENECRQMLYTASTLNAPAIVRYPRGAGPGAAVSAHLSALPLGKAQLRREGKSGLALLAFGALVNAAQPIAEALDATLVNMRFVKPLDESLVVALAARHRALVTIEENATHGGAGSTVLEVLAAEALQLPVLQLGIPDRFIEHGSRESCLRAAGLDAAGLGIILPLTITVRSASEQHTIASFKVYVGLPHNFKSTLMSRFVEILHGEREISVESFRGMLHTMTERLEADTGHIEMSFPFFVMKRAPVSGVESLMDYRASLIGEHRRGHTEMWVRVSVPVTSLCPCSKNISDYGAHNQRSHVTITAKLRSHMWIEELIEIAESEASCELYGILKRPDEKYVTERAYDNPKFVEDMVRDVATRLNRDARVAAYLVESENFESIHNHSAYALIEHDKDA